MTLPIVQSYSIKSRNTEVPFFPSFNYQLFNTDFVASTAYSFITLPTFSWIQAFYDAANITVLPQLVIFNGADDTVNNTPIFSLVQFAYSGERVNIKGRGIITSATDIRGNSITSTPIGPTHTSDLLQVFAYSGMY